MMNDVISVVIVENQPILRAALSSTLSAEGMTVLAEMAESREALRMSPRLHPSVFLLAVGTPGRRELENIPALRKLMPASAIIALVTGEIFGQEQTALNQGADTVLTKSVPRAELLKVIKKAAQKKLHSILKSL